METIGKKIKVARKQKGLTQSELAVLCGWGQFPSRISNYERALREPKSNDLLKIAQALNVSVEWLYSDAPIDTYESGETYVMQHCHPIRWVPVIAWHEILTFKPNIQRYEEALVCTQSIGGNSFALKVEGDSMQSPVGETFLPGSYIIVDTQREPLNNHYVIAQVKPKTVPTFKQLMVDGGIRYLKPLNPRYPIIEAEPETVIIGVVCEMIKKMS